MIIISGAIALLIVIAALFYGFYSSRMKFRQMLPGELAGWLKDGLIGETEAGRIRKRYKLADIQAESQAILINAIFIFGAFLIASGVVAFVAAHWDGIPRLWKLVLITGVMLAVHCTGFYFWKGKANLPRLGHALVLLGTLLFGANIALIAQIFHLSANFYDGFLIWTIGALVMAYVTESIPLAALSAITSFIWFCGWKSDNLNGLSVYPWLVLLCFLPFAYRHRSRGVHFLALLGWGAGLIISGITTENFSALLVIILTALAALMYWSYPDWSPRLRTRVIVNDDLQDDSKFLGVLLLGLLGYILSFHEIIRMVIKLNWEFALGWNVFLTMITFFLAVFSVVFGCRKVERKDKVAYQTLPVIATILILVAGFCWLLGLIASTILCNLALILLGVFLFWYGLNEFNRRYFWLGLGLLVLEIVSRFFEYDTGLLLKSFAFVMAGLILIFGGTGFEKRYRKQVTENE